MNKLNLILSDKDLELNFKNINKITISVLINCGFYEYSQNDIAVEMIKLYAKKLMQILDLF